jgi:hypothetical protein
LSKDSRVSKNSLVNGIVKDFIEMEKINAAASFEQKNTQGELPCSSLYGFNFGTRHIEGKQTLTSRTKEEGESFADFKQDFVNFKAIDIKISGYEEQAALGFCDPESQEGN